MGIDDAIEKMHNHFFDVIVLDLYLQHHHSPIENFTTIQKAFPEKPIVIFTAETCQYWKYTMFDLGAYAFISKISRTESLTEGIECAAARKIQYTDDVKHFFIPDIDDDSPLSITADELKIARLLSTGCLIKHISKECGKSTSSIEKTLRALREKLMVLTNPELIRKMIFLDLIPPV